MNSKLRKWLSLMVATAAVSFGVLFSSTTEASAEQIDASAISIDYENQKMTIGKSSNKEIIFGISTVKTNKKTEKNVINTPSWDVYEDTADGVTIDLSFLSNVKDNYVQVMGELQNDPITIKIPAAPQKIKSSFNALTGKVLITDKNNQSFPEDTKYEYRTQYGNWQNYALSDELSMYQKHGGTLFFRIKSSETGSLNDYETTEMLTDAEGNDVSVKIVGSFPGKELKVKIPTLSNPPKINVNYEKRTVTIPKGALYRILEPHGNGKYYLVSPWVESDGKPIMREYDRNDNASINDVEYLKRYFIGGAGIIETKTKATDKKPSSRIGRLVTTAKNEVADNGVGYVWMEGKFPHYMGCDMKVGLDWVYQDVSNILDVMIKSEKKVSKGKTTYTLTFTNTGMHTYQVALRDTLKMTDNVKTKNIAAASGAGQTKVTKITGIKEGQYVSVRIPGSNKLKLWAGEFTDLGQICEN